MWVSNIKQLLDLYPVEEEQYNFPYLQKYFIASEYKVILTISNLRLLQTLVYFLQRFIFPLMKFDETL